MADPYRKNEKWYLRYKNAFGRWVDEPSSALTKTEAKRLSLELQQKAER